MRDGVIEHVLIARKALGKSLPKRAHVHHVNEDGRDNRNQNLVICQDLAYHRLLHIRRDVLKAGGDPNVHRICYGCKQLRLFIEFGQGGHMDRGGGMNRCCLRCAAARTDARRRAAGIKRRENGRKYLESEAIRKFAAEELGVVIEDPHAW